MNQVLHIFRKDTRRFWPEILAAIVVVTGFAVTEPNIWNVSLDEDTFRVVRVIVASFLFLIPASWWFLTVRAVQEEGLVGDRHFWMTRPYQWDRLLASKILLVLAWIAVPYTIVQLVILKEAGFQAFGDLAGVTRNSLALSGAVVLPVLAIAAVMGSLVRVVLTLLGAFLALFACGVYVTLHGSYSISLSSTGSMVLMILVAGCAVVITLQYATRRAWLSRVVLFGALPLLTMMAAAASHRQSLIDRTYPVPAAGSAPVFLAGLDTKSNVPVAARSWHHDDYIDMPMLYSGVAEGSAVLPNDFRFTLSSPDGAQWTSPWQKLEDHIRPGEHQSSLSLMLSPEVFERFRKMPVTLHVEFAVSVYRAEKATTIPYPARDTAVPGIGFCMPFHKENAALYCRSAVTDAPLTYAQALWRTGNCQRPGGSVADTQPESDWIHQGGVGLPFDSVRASIFLMRPGEAHSGRWQVCPGSPLTLTQYELANRTRAEMTVPNFQIPTEIEKTD